MRYVSVISALVIGTLASACSSSSDSTTPDTVHDSAVANDTGTTTEDTAADTGSTTEDTGSTTEDTGTVGDGSMGDAGSTCGSDPMLHAPKAGDGVYCPGVGDGGTGANCAAGQICCDTPKGSTPASSCIAAGGTCPTTMPKPGSSWECDAPSQCGTGKICCGTGTPTLRKGCTYEEVFPSTSTSCAASCPATSFIVCEAPGDCPSGKTCTAIKSGGKQIGYCK